MFQCAFLLSVQVISGDDDPAGKQLCASEHFRLCHFIRNIVTCSTEFMMQVHDPHTVVLVSCSQTAPFSLCKAGRHIRLCVSVTRAGSGLATRDYCSLYFVIIAIIDFSRTPKMLYSTAL